MSEPSITELRQEIGFLGVVLGETIRECSGDAAFEIVEQIRQTARDRRVGQDRTDTRVKQLIARLDDDQMRVVIRAFTIFLDLLNMVEDRRRVRVIDQRTRAAHPSPRGESIGDAITQLASAGVSAERLQSLLDRLRVELVFTAHPTEAKRKSIRSKLRALRNLMKQREAGELPEIHQRVEERIRAEVTKLWQTDFIRPWRPSVMQEVGRGLSIKPVLWSEVPRIADDLRRATHAHYGDAVQPRKPNLTFGSWIGGDRDGHPGVTAEVTEETLGWLRHEAIAFHLQTCDHLLDGWSMSQRQIAVESGLRAKIDAAVEHWPMLKERLDVWPPGELCRRWLTVIRWRLEQTEEDLGRWGSSSSTSEDSESGAAETDAAYESACELAGDVAALDSELGQFPGSGHVRPELRRWQTQIESFGLHLARLDVRQNAKVYREVINEIFRQNGIHETPESLDEEGRCRCLAETLELKLPIATDVASPAVRETLRLFSVLHRAVDRFSFAAIGAHVISMTSAPSDVLTVLWLWRQTSPADSSQKSGPGLPIAPLLETIGDLQNGEAILSGMLENPAYREYLRGQGDEQMIMLGYSDSTKDGGYLAACWSLYQTQQDLVRIAERYGVRLVFFHGRGGSLGRGGGPAARSILSLPEGTFDGRLRLTEQGEVLADRYDDPAIAHRHLEQVIWSALLAAGNPHGPTPQRWKSLMETISAASLGSYRELLEKPRFVPFFRKVTPISEIEQLPIGSRPSRRKPDGGLEDLRAIPWVFSWTQSRCLIPAWYGIGSALTEAAANESTRDELQTMYQQWPFFRAVIDNAELALAKSDLEIASEYAELAGDDEALNSIGSMVAAEYRKACDVILKLTGREELLDATPWLKESIRVRNRFIDPLNLIQVELLRRGQHPPESDQEAEELRHLTRLSINGIAAGMRTSG